MVLPDKHTNKERLLDVGNGHVLSVADWGNKDAQLVIVHLHGGPGGGTSDGVKQRYDPTKQRVLFFDQRGSGTSTPKGELKHNQTDEMIEDIERIRQAFGVRKMILTGGSWGSCLALLYGITYPRQVEAMVLQGIFTGTKSEIDFINNGGFKHFYPDVWQTYLDATPATERSDPSRYHYKQALKYDSDPEAAKASLYAYSEMESSLLRLDERRIPQDYASFDPSSSKVELHYLKNHCFIPDGFILSQVNLLTMPIWLIAGRYDMVCPPITAYALHHKLPNSRLVLTTAGHGNDRPNFDLMRSLLLQLSLPPQNMKQEL